MIRNYGIFILLSIVVAGEIGCGLFSNKTSEMVYPATEIGTAVGGGTNKNIGPEGGTLTSPDGKLTVTVPKNAVAESVLFSIQPITNTMENAIGNGFRLEPSGKTFATPLQISVRYDEKDLEGTVPEALSLAYQDQNGAWHAQTSSKVDEAARTLSVSTTHFSDWLFLRTVGISPAKATVLVGETVYIKVDSCPDRDPLQKYNIWKYVFGHDCRKVSTNNSTWSLNGEGRLTSTDNASGIVYTAPAVKPQDPVAHVIVDIDIPIRDPDTGEVKTYSRKFESRIKIVDRGYKATGNTGDAQYSGVVCLDSPFTINADVKIINFALDFTPVSDTGGTWKMSGSMPFLRGSGSGSYTFEDSTGAHPPRLALTGTSTGTIPVGSRTKVADTYIGLIPNDGNECIQKTE